MRRLIALIFVLTLDASSSFAQPSISIEIVSQPSVVFDWSTQHCDDSDIPDAPIRAVRLSNGTVLAFDSFINNRRFLGRDLDTIHRDCAVIYKSKQDADPAEYADRTWIAAPWTNNGTTIYALAHNEYHGERHPGHCTFPSQMACWYNTILLLKSDDSGRTFIPASQKPVAAPPFKQDVDQGRPRGFFNPSNIVKKDEYYYTLIRVRGRGAQRPGNCLFRARNVGDASSWAYYDGQTFVPSALDPYKDESDLDKVPPCAPLNNLPGAIGSLVIHQRTELFVTTMEIEKPGEQDGAVVFSTSADLINWTKPQTITRLPMGNSTQCSDTFRFQYPSLLDPKSPSRNFESVSDDPFLYVTRVHIAKCGMTMDRDLVRMQVKVH